MSIHAGVDLARQRLQQRATFVAAALSLAFVLGVAVRERAQGAIGATDRALLGGTSGVALPLVCYFLVGRACDGTSLRGALLPLARHGLDRRALTLGLALPPALLAAIFGGLSSLLVVVLTRGASGAGLLSDAWTSLWIGIVSGPAYVAALLGASAGGRRGQGRSWLLGADFVLGAGDSFTAFPWPKGHVRNLLGGAPILQFSWQAALVALVGTSFAFLYLGSLRNQR